MPGNARQDAQFLAWLSQLETVAGKHEVRLDVEGTNDTRVPIELAGHEPTGVGYLVGFRFVGGVNASYVDLRLRTPSGVEATRTARARLEWLRQRVHETHALECLKPLGVEPNWSPDSTRAKDDTARVEVRLAFGYGDPPNWPDTQDKLVHAYLCLKGDLVPLMVEAGWLRQRGS